MGSADHARRLIVNADDFGRSDAVNQAVIQAHREGILTSASLMVSGPAFAEAVGLARAHPALGVGLHLSLVRAHSACKPADIPGLVDDRCRFSDRPIVCGLRYFFNRRLRGQLRCEIEGQVQKFRATGLPLDHLDGHLHLHLHPTVLSLLSDHARSWGLKSLRLTRDPFWLNARLAGGRWFYRLTQALVFDLLAASARPVVQRQGLRHTRFVFGLLQNGRVDEDYLLRLLPRLPAGDAELYCHPSREGARHELEALTSQRVKALVAQLGIQLIRYPDL
jgi:hopanoid biosynthesis associated protein HpnK